MAQCEACKNSQSVSEFCKENPKYDGCGPDTVEESQQTTTTTTTTTSTTRSTISQSDEEVQQPDEEVQQPDKEVQQPDEEVQQPDKEVHQPDEGADWASDDGQPPGCGLTPDGQYCSSHTTNKGLPSAWSKRCTWHRCAACQVCATPSAVS